MSLHNKTFPLIILLFFVAILLISCGGGSSKLDSYGYTRDFNRSQIADQRTSISSCLTKGNQEIIRREYIKRINANTIMTPKGGFDPRHYPAEVIASLYSIGLEFGDEHLIKWAEQQLENLFELIDKNNGYWVWPEQIDGAPTFGELAQSRLVFSLGLIYKRKPSEKTLRTFNLAYGALDRLPLASVVSSITQSKYSLPFYAFHNVHAPTPISFRSLDPNHDAALAAAYAIASTIKADKSEVSAALDKSNSYYKAALDMAGLSCLPLADQPEYVRDCDTRYNSFWLMLMQYSSVVLKQSYGEHLLQKQFDVIKPNLVKFSTRRTYPAVYVGEYPDPIEPMLLSVAVAKYCNDVEWRDYVIMLNAYIEKAGQDIDKWPAGWLYPKFLVIN